MSRDLKIISICNSINSKRLVHSDRVEIVAFIADRIGLDKIISKGPDCAIFLKNLNDADVDIFYDMINERIKKNNKIVKEMYKN